MSYDDLEEQYPDIFNYIYVQTGFNTIDQLIHCVSVRNWITLIDNYANEHAASAVEDFADGIINVINDSK